MVAQPGPEWVELTPEARAPADMRWVRSANNHLHAAEQRRNGRTVCGIALSKMAFTNFCGPGVRYGILRRSPYPICQHCLARAEWRT